MEEAASNPLHGKSIIPLIHVRTGWSDKKGEVREIPTALRDTTSCVLESIGEWLVENWGYGISCDSEPDKESHGR
jgi:hypothetical protein